MTHVVRTRLLTLCLAILPAAIVFSLLLLAPLSGLSQTPTFTAHSFTYGTYNLPALHADLNNDGYEDLIAFDNGSSVAGCAPTVFRVYLSKGNGSYSAPISYTLPNGMCSNAQPLFGDFNGDGKLDLVVEAGAAGGGGPFGFSTYLGNGDGTFRAPINSTVEYLGYTMAAADVNHDGKLDLLVVTARGSASLQVLFGNGDGSFTLGPVSAFDIYEVDTILIGDFDGDGNVDVAAVWPSGPPPDGPAGGGGTQFDVLSGDGTGNFAITYAVYSGGTYFGLIAADVNGDGISDLISQTQLGEPGLTIFYGAPNRAMQFAQIPTERCAPNNFSTMVAVADFNGDQIPDIAFPDSECGGQNATRITILPGKGNNQFGFDIPVFSATSIFPLVFGLRGNRDTKADLAFQTSTSTKTAIVTLLNTTTGNFPTCAPPNTAVGIAQCSPVSGSTVTSPVNFAIGAAADKPIRKVDVWVDRTKQFEQFAGAFSNYAFLNASLPLAAGSHRVSVIAYGWDNSQVSKTSTIDVKASSSCSAPASDGVHICSPTSGSSVSSPVLVTATSKVTGTIASTQLWIDGVKKYSTASKSLNTSISLAAGSHRFAVIATNTSGQKWESTVTATVK
jgi:hypothetical protein